MTFYKFLCKWKNPTILVKFTALNNKAHSLLLTAQLVPYMRAHQTSMYHHMFCMIAKHQAKPF